MPPRNAPAVVGPVWKGPCDTGPQGGVTVSLLQRFLACRARFKAYSIDGWRAAPKFNHRIFFGSMWHAAEESFAKDGDPQTAVEVALDYAEVESEKYPANREDIRKWWNVLRVTFPEYVRYWLTHSEVVNRTPLLQEKVFDVPYHLPSGRVVRLRGKWDGVDLVTDPTNPENCGVYLFETKTKGDVDEIAMQRQLVFDLQVGVYLVALQVAKTSGFYSFAPDDYDIKGVRYNVVRRPLSGGKGTIVQHKPTKKNPEGESESGYYQRLGMYIADEPETYFFRWTVGIIPEDIAKFKREFLDPCLEFMCGWYAQQTSKIDDVVRRFVLTDTHWRTPFGLTSEIVDGYGSDLDNYIDTGGTVGLVRTDDLFPELKE